MKKSGYKLFFSVLLIASSVLSAQENYQEKVKSYKESLAIDPCNAQALIGLNELLDPLKRDPKYANLLLQVTDLLLECYPNEPDYLFFNAKAHYLLNQKKEAEIKLLTCLDYAPNYIDAALLLASIYQLEGKYDEGIKLLKKFPSSGTIFEKLGDLNLMKEDYDEAANYYKKLLRLDPKNPKFIKKYANALKMQKHYAEAEDVLDAYLQDQPDKELERLQMEVEEFSNPSFNYQMNYTQSKENDPGIQKPVVRNYYVDQSLNFYVPIFDHLSSATKIMFDLQQEIDIYPPTGSNYNVSIYGLQEKIKWDFFREWYLNFVVRGLYADNLGDNFYPFQNTFRFEPGITLVYQGSKQFFYADAHIESFIIKNFAIQKSQLLRQDFLDFGYGVSFPFYIKPEIEAGFAKIFYHDSIDNKEQVESISCNFKRKLENKGSLNLAVRFDHSSFDQLTPNYFSYKNQYLTTLKFNFFANLGFKTIFEGGYEHAWQVTSNLLQPIGNFIFVAKRQSLLTNKVYGKLQANLIKTLFFELYGHYFETNLPYREYKAALNLRYQF